MQTLSIELPAAVPPPIPIRVMIADDHPLVLMALERVIDSLPDVALAGCAASIAELLDVSGHASFDVLLMGFEMAGSGAAPRLDALAEVRASRPDAAIVVLTVSADAQVLNAALAHGAVAVISKRDRVDLIHVALVAAHARERYLGPRIRDALYEGMPGSPAEQWRARLTRREFEVLRLYASGHAISDIARQAGRSVKTISAQKCRAMRKLNLGSDADVYRFALTSGMISSVQCGSEM